VPALPVGARLLVGGLGEFYGLSVVFGVACGGVMPLYAILVREHFGARTMGTTFGAVSMVANLGMALGPWAGGWVFDAFDSYSWLYLGSLGIGLGAVAIALTFPPVHPKARGVPRELSLKPAGTGGTPAEPALPDAQSRGAQSANPDTRHAAPEHALDRQIDGEYRRAAIDLKHVPIDQRTGCP